MEQRHSVAHQVQSFPTNLRSIFVACITTLETPGPAVLIATTVMVYTAPIFRSVNKNVVVVEFRVLSPVSPSVVKVS